MRSGHAYFCHANKGSLYLKVDYDACTNQVKKFGVSNEPVDVIAYLGCQKQQKSGKRGMITFEWKYSFRLG